MDELADEWRSYRRGEKIPLGEDSVPSYWYKLRELHGAMDQPRFRLLSHLFVHLTILPHSSAAVERVFSQVNSVKTKTTNRLNVDSVNKKLLAKQAVTKRGMNCTTWTPPLQLVKDVADGTCHKRYIQRMKAQQSENSVTVTVFEDSQNVPDSTPQ